MKVNGKLQEIKDEAYRKGQSAAERRLKKELKELEKKNAANIKQLAQAHRQELSMMERKLSNKMRRLEKKEAGLDKAIREWHEKIEEAENFIADAKSALSEKQAEKREIFQKLARHIAKENYEIDELVSAVYNSKIKHIEKNPYLLRKSS